jgi:hypothetical protein
MDPPKSKGRNVTAYPGSVNGILQVLAGGKLREMEERRVDRLPPFLISIGFKGFEALDFDSFM